ncbi:hypothetical protein [Sphingopyxis sp. BSNA05]|uniref:hypothetical protein n=1 Tax=Sphingopyxis sp. BSNA05 TaxID=1236614 RepID=UPI0015670FEF|nr:hypothetical protein [Sphingopyxis sp. BSNA05]
MRMRHKRYLKTAAVWIIVIWALTGLFLALAPDQYRSKFTLILPGSGAGGSLNVESIGQAQSSVASAFSSATLSPTENYKRLLMTDRTLRQSAEKSGDRMHRFPAPNVKLIDQTNLIQVEVVGASGEQANKRAIALKDTFLNQLDELRKNEAEMRENSDNKNLIVLEKKVRTTQQALLDFQAKTGLVSLDQFNTRIANMDALRQQEREARIMLRQKAAESGRFSSILGKSVSGANTALRLRSDPVFQQLADRYAKLEVETREKEATLGDNHGDMVQARSERDQLQNALLERGRALTGLGSDAILKNVDIAVADGRTNMMQGMIVANSQSAGARAGLAEIRRDISNQSMKSSELVKQASQLADLVRDHRVAEAVFSSALARVDTNKQDPFASYPLVQTLEQPSLPQSPSSPSVLLALAGATGATIIILIGLALLWFRQPIIRRIAPNI